MPGLDVPEFRTKAGQMAKAGIHDLRIHHDQVVLPVLFTHWEIDRLDGLTDEASRLATASWVSSRRSTRPRRATRRSGPRRRGAERDVATIDLRSAAVRPRAEPVYRTVVRFALATRALMRWDLEVSGAEHIPRSGPAVIASNHIGNLDFVFLGFAAHARRRLVRFMAMQEAFDHWLAGPLLRGMRHIPVDRSGDPAAAYDHAIRALESGQIVGIHPEGKINRSLIPGSGKSGAVRMAEETGAPLIPAAVWGTQRILAPGIRPRFPRKVGITVRLGPPLEADGLSGPEETTVLLMERIRGLWASAVTADGSASVGEVARERGSLPA
jgi:1-acyl-sn-glycerol-3-phosphate acyltransferase